jgi:hypothetical protein
MISSSRASGRKRTPSIRSPISISAPAYKRLRVTGGLRWERVEGWIPEQSSPPSQWFPEGTIIPTTVAGRQISYEVRRSFEEVRNIPLWKNVGPRVSAVYDLWETARLRSRSRPRGTTRSSAQARPPGSVQMGRSASGSHGTTRTAMWCSRPASRGGCWPRAFPRPSRRSG